MKIKLFFRTHQLRFAHGEGSMSRSSKSRTLVNGFVLGVLSFCAGTISGQATDISCDGIIKETTCSTAEPAYAGNRSILGSGSMIDGGNELLLVAPYRASEKALTRSTKGGESNSWFAESSKNDAVILTANRRSRRIIGKDGERRALVSTTTLAQILDLYFGQGGVKSIIENFDPDDFLDLPSEFEEYFVEKFIRFFLSSKDYRFASFSPRDCLHPRRAQCTRVQHLIEASLYHLAEKSLLIVQLADAKCLRAVRRIPANGPDELVHIGKWISVLRRVIVRFRGIHPRFREWISMPSSLSELQDMFNCRIENVLIEPQTASNVLGHNFHFEVTVIGGDGLEFPGYPIVGEISGRVGTSGYEHTFGYDSPATSGDFELEPAETGRHALLVFARPTETTTQQVGGGAELFVFPDLVGTWTGAGSETWTGCLDETDNGNYSGSVELEITAQIFTPGSFISDFNGSFSGDVTLGSLENAVVSNFEVVDEILAGATYIEVEVDPTTNEIFVVEGRANVKGTVTGDTMNLNWTFWDTQGDTCSGPGSATLNKN